MRNRSENIVRTSVGKIVARFTLPCEEGGTIDDRLPALVKLSAALSAMLGIEG